MNEYDLLALSVEVTTRGALPVRPLQASLFTHDTFYYYYSVQLSVPGFLSVTTS